MAAGTDVSPLVPCDWLKEKIAAGDLGNIVLLDVSWSSQKDCYEDYKQRHIPGAVFFNVMVGPHTDLFPRNLPTPEVFQDLTRAAGVNDDSHVILYSDSDNCGFFMSGRAWWTFTMFGAKKVSILNGGLQRWLTLGYPTTSEVPTVKRGNFTARYDSQHRLTFEEMTQRIASGATIADSRPVKSYTEGHIPGAVSLPYTTLMDSDKQEMKPVDQVKAVMKGAGVDTSKPFISYCNSGMSSSTLSFAYALCGGSDFAVYHGGFTEWKNKAQDRIEKS